MKRIYVHQDFTRVGHCRSMLEQVGIPCFVQNENTYHLMTGIPIPTFYPVLCVTHDEDAAQATELLREYRDAENSDTPDWKCPQCGETVPGNFGSCWKCDALRPAT